MFKKLFVFFCISFLSLNAQKIKLPIEVFGVPSNVPRSTSELSSLNLKLGIDERRFTLDQNMLNRIASSEKGLYLQINNASYNKKIAIIVNDQNPIVLDQGGDAYNSNAPSTKVEIYAQEAARGGMVHGGYNTIRLKVLHVKRSHFKLGQNKIRFRFEKSDGISSGFRVIDMDLLDSSGNRILKENPYFLPRGQIVASSRQSGVSYFTEDDPLTWTDPYTEDGIALTTQQLQDSIDAGKDLWYYGRGGDFASKTMGADMWSNYLPTGKTGFWYGYDLGESKKMKAKCTNCHTQDGRDLEIFAYSNKSIIERAKFHRLTEEEGKLIATYIRSLSATDGNKGNIHRYGRPWNPPYQPGTSLAGKSVDEWSAGAGLDAVLDEDKDMLPYLFPKGTSQRKVYEHFNSDSTMDRTELPLAIQLPDWKHWLPIVHPMDAYKKDNHWNNPLANTSVKYIHIDGINTGVRGFHPKDGYQSFRSFLKANKAIYSSNTITSVQADDLMKRVAIFWWHYRGFLAHDAPTWSHWRSRNGTASTKLQGVPRELAATSLARLMGVQFFEVMNEFGLQDKAQHWYGDAKDHVNKRQWIGENYQVFEIPAHFQACVPSNEVADNPPYHNLIIATGTNKCQNFYGQPRATGQFESTNWYHLQSVINGGEGMMAGNSPVDYNYQQEFILKSNRSSGIYEPLRYFHTQNVMYQTKTWSKDKDPNDGKGFRMRVMGPWYFLGKEADAGNSQLHSYAPLEFVKKLNGVESGLLKKVLNAQFKQFLTEVRKTNNRLYLEDNGNYGSANENWWRFDNTLPENPENLNNKKGGNRSQNLDARSKTAIKDVEEAVSSTNPMYADHMYWVIKKAKALGVDCDILHDLKNWSKEAWPNIRTLSKKSGSNQTVSWDGLLNCSTYDFEDGTRVTIKAKSLNKYLSSENGARQATVTRNNSLGWEKFTLQTVPNTDNVYYIKGNNNKYISSNSTSAIIFNQTTTTVDQQVVLEPLGGNKYALKGRNNKYLTHENGGINPVRFHRNTPAAWETFIIERVTTPSLAFNPENITINDEYSAIHILQNPVANILSVTNLKQGNYTVSIYDFMGKVIRITTLNQLNNTIDVSEISQGNYVLRLQSKTDIKTLPFIKK